MFNLLHEEQKCGEYEWSYSIEQNRGRTLVWLCPRNFIAFGWIEKCFIPCVVSNIVRCEVVRSQKYLGHGHCYYSLEENV